MDEKKIEQKLDLVERGAIPVESVGGVSLKYVHDTLDIAHWLAKSDIAVPAAFRNKPGACWRVVMQSLDWGMPIYALMDHAYVVNDKVAYEAKVLHALIEKSGVLAKRLRPEYIGEGQDRQCRVVGLFKDEIEPCVYESPKIKDIFPKNSPLWKSDPDQQLWYFSVRRWRNKWAPNTALGFYGRDEADDDSEHIGPAKAKDVTPKPSLKDRLKGNTGRGFDAGHVASEAEKMTASAAPHPPAEGKAGEAGRVASQEVVEQSTSASPAEPMSVPDALEYGRRLKAEGKPLEIPPEIAGDTFAPHRDAMAAGYQG